jgi:putative ABC transport system permease protein
VFKRILKKDIARNKVITATLFLFIMLAAMFISSAAGVITELSGAMNTLLRQAEAPHFAQMHSGEIAEDEINFFASENEELISDHQIVRLLNINGINIFLGNNDVSEADSVMENAFVMQNDSFDFLLDTDGEVLQIKNGEVAVPLYHMQKYGLRVGDSIRIKADGFEMHFTISSFLRDSIMNPSLINSKRFLISMDDWETLRAHLGEIEYIIELQVSDINRVGEIETLYQNAGMPQKGAVMTHDLVIIINAMSDGIAAALIILVGILLSLIAALCLRFTLLATIEEDYREIGVMKAIGIHSREIRKLYLTKYSVMAAAACLCGYALSFLTSNFFTANIALYMGRAEETIFNTVLPLVGAVLVFAAVVLFCRLVLRRFRSVSAVEAIRNGSSPKGNKTHRSMKLSKSRFPNVSIFLGVKEVCSRFKEYGILCFIFIICSFLIIMPLNFLNTLESPDFVRYMGIGKSDIRVDLQHTDDIVQRYNDVITYMKTDTDAEKYAALLTGMYQTQNSEGEYENIKIDVGDFSVFSLEYAVGSSPKNKNEIALSVMNAEAFEKTVGDTLTVITEGEARTMQVCGIYQDVTNGGRTAKAVLPENAENAVWFSLNIDVKDGVSLLNKIEEYKDAFYPAKVTDIRAYVYQTMGSVIDQLKIAVKAAFALALAVAVLITALFFKMLIAKDASQIAIMRSLGISYRGIQAQYITRAIIVLIIGIIVGSIAAVTLGANIAVLLVAGVSQMRFVINPIMSFIVCPFTLAALVALTVLIGTSSIKRINIMLAATGGQ